MKKYIYFGLILLTLSSCVSRKEMIYLQDMDETVDYPVIQQYDARIQCDDKLNIVVSSKNPELAMAFNLPGFSGYSVNERGDVTQTKNPTTNEKDMGYLVDSDGNIEFPVLGVLHVEGLTRNQLKQMIKNKLLEQQLLNDPVVFVDFMNFKFTVLGEVGSVGTYNLSGGDKITILEAIAQAGDLKNTSRIDRVAVIRDYGNKRRIMHLDLRSKDIFLSPAYYLQQNDIVYVEPNGLRADQDSQRRFSYWTTGLSVLTTLTTLVLYFLK